VVGTQALASGLAIVAGNVGGFTDLVNQGKNGFLFNSDDTNAMVKVLRNYCIDRDLLLKSRKSSLLMAERFDINRVVDRYESALRKVAE
jgi:glycosyltransferase involved in cell wall biosynthesis